MAMPRRAPEKVSPKRPHDRLRPDEASPTPGALDERGVSSTRETNSSPSPPGVLRGQSTQVVPAVVNSCAPFHAACHSNPAMTETLLAHEPVIRLAAFLGVFSIVAFGEARRSRRPRTATRRARWPSNLGLVAVNTLVLRAVPAFSAVLVAAWAQDRGFGFLHQPLVTDLLPAWTRVLLCVVFLDLLIYWQHRIFHAVPLLWRIHRVHHADRDIDVTTGLRFHPVELVLSMGIKIGTVLALGAPPVAVMLFEVILNATSDFNHGNLGIPTRVDAVLRLFVVTPDMHRVHHSTRPEETNSNFGFNLPVWDRLFGTYRAQPALGHDRMKIGVAGVDESVGRTLVSMLRMPFVDVTRPDHGRTT